jgi:hypothetical protein
MSVGVLPHVKDSRSIEQYYADIAAHARREAIARARPQMDAAARVLAALVPGWQQLPEERRQDVAFSIVQAVEADF